MHSPICQETDTGAYRVRLSTYLGFASVVLLLSLSQAARAQATYRITDLGALPGGNFSQALGLNNRGEVVGRAGVLSDTEFHAFFWRQGRMIDLGKLQGPNSAATSINNSGEVAGTAELMQTQDERVLCEEAWASGVQVCRAVFWSGGALKDLGTLGGSNSVTFGINDRHQVVGAADTADSLHAFVFSKGILRDLGTPFDIDSAGAAINDGGQVAVNAHISLVENPNLGEPDYHAFLWERGHFTDLGTLGGSASYANGMNNKTQVVGFSCLSGDLTCNAFLWENDLMKDLGVLPGDFASFALKVNQCGEVVGFSLGETGIRPFIWRKNQMADLNTLLPPNSGWTLRGATGINNGGQIVGDGLHNGIPRGFLLTPKHEVRSESCEDGDGSGDNAGQAFDILVEPTNASSKIDAHQEVLIRGTSRLAEIPGKWPKVLTPKSGQPGNPG